VSLISITIVLLWISFPSDFYIKVVVLSHSMVKTVVWVYCVTENIYMKRFITNDIQAEQYFYSVVEQSYTLLIYLSANSSKKFE
jgi:hypothetical protein